MGDLGSVAALEGQGESREKASTVLYTQDLFIWLEIACFFVLGIVLAGWDTSILQVFPAAIFFGVLYFITRPGQRKKALADVPGGGPLPVAIIRGLCTNPLLWVWLVALSLLAFFLDDVTPYIISQAFTEGPVILNVPFLVIQGGVVAGYLASRIPITPGTIGQFEFGFGTALLMSGVDLNVAIAIIIIDGLIRHGVAISLFVIVKVFYGVEAKLSSVFELFMGRSSNAVALTGE